MTHYGQQSMGLEDPAMQNELQHQRMVSEGYDLGGMKTVATTTSLHPTIVHEQLENQKVLQDIELQLRGYVRDFSTGALVFTGYPLIPKEEGVYSFLVIARSHLDKNISISDVTDEEIYKHMLDLNIEIISLLRSGYHKYQIKKEHLGLIVRIICTPIFWNLKRSKGGRQLDAMSQIVKENFTQQAPRQGGIISRMLRL